MKQANVNAYRVTGMCGRVLQDIAEYLTFVSRFAPAALAGERLDEFMSFLVLFAGSPAYVKNPYLRSKLVEVLRCWIPNTDPRGRDTPVQAYTRARARPD